MSLFFSGAFVMVVRPSFFLNCPAPAIEKKIFFWKNGKTEDRKAKKSVGSAGKRRGGKEPIVAYSQFVGSLVLFSLLSLLSLFSLFS